jgi:hypothetical protein
MELKMLDRSLPQIPLSVLLTASIVRPSGRLETIGIPYSLGVGSDGTEIALSAVIVRMIIIRISFIGMLRGLLDLE